LIAPLAILPDENDALLRVTRKVMPAPRKKAPAIDRGQVVSREDADQLI
jgi:hypothetical protein